MRCLLRLPLTFALTLLTLIVVQPAAAEVRLPAILGDNMVLQRDVPLTFWGTADPGEPVAVSISQNGEAMRPNGIIAGRDGRWAVTVPPISSSGPVTVQILGTNTITLKNVLVGDVWICSGQSNMVWPVRQSNDADDEIAAADHPKIRLFKVAQKTAPTPLEDVEGEWVECSPETVGDFSAVGYYFGRALQQATGSPVGLVQTAWGGTPAEAWTSAAMLQTDPQFRPILNRWENLLADPEAVKARQAEHQQALAAWRETAREARQQGRPAPRAPRPPLGPDHPHRPSSLYNAMIAPLTPLAIKGVIWYQGESNASRAYQYRALFAAMIRDWRKQWDQGDFPFLFVQLANYRKVAEEPGGSEWAELREAQTMALALPATGMALAIDIGEADDIHPRNKQDVGTRLALAARRIACGEDVVHSGPMLRSMTIENNRIRIQFSHVGGGLAARGGKLQGFAIAGSDQKFVRAEAEIDGDTVVVRSPDVPHPLAVRYAWADNPVCNLYNADGLPAVPFRTDDWPGVTADAR